MDLSLPPTQFQSSPPPEGDGESTPRQHTQLGEVAPGPARPPHWDTGFRLCPGPGRGELRNPVESVAGGAWMDVYRRRRTRRAGEARTEGGGRGGPGATGGWVRAGPSRILCGPRSPGKGLVGHRTWRPGWEAGGAGLGPGSERSVGVPCLLPYRSRWLGEGQSWTQTLGPLCGQGPARLSGSPGLFHTQRGLTALPSTPGHAMPGLGPNGWAMGHEAEPQDRGWSRGSVGCGQADKEGPRISLAIWGAAGLAGLDDNRAGALAQNGVCIPLAQHRRG